MTAAPGWIYSRERVWVRRIGRSEKGSCVSTQNRDLFKIMTHEPFIILGNLMWNWNVVPVDVTVVTVMLFFEHKTPTIFLLPFKHSKPRIKPVIPCHFWENSQVHLWTSQMISMWKPACSSSCLRTDFNYARAEGEWNSSWTSHNVNQPVDSKFSQNGTNWSFLWSF